MRFQATVLAFAATLAFTSAQDLSNVPQCAISCFVAALPASKCATTDIKCQCTTGREPLQESLMSCVPTKCSTEESQKVVPAVSAICASAGVTISNIPTNTAGSTPAATAPGGNSAAPSPSGAPSGAASGSPSGSRPSGTTSSTPQSTGAASGNVAAIGAVALGLAAVFGL